MNLKDHVHVAIAIEIVLLRRRYTCQPGVVMYVEEVKSAGGGIASAPQAPEASRLVLPWHVHVHVRMHESATWSASPDRTAEAILASGLASAHSTLRDASWRMPPCVPRAASLWMCRTKAASSFGAAIFKKIYPFPSSSLRATFNFNPNGQGGGADVHAGQHRRLRGCGSIALISAGAEG